MHVHIHPSDENVHRSPPRATEGCESEAVLRLSSLMGVVFFRRG
jgi:hypothetical protein